MSAVAEGTRGSGATKRRRFQRLAHIGRAAGAVAGGRAPCLAASRLAVTRRLAQWSAPRKAHAQWVGAAHKRTLSFRRIAHYYDRSLDKSSTLGQQTALPSASAAPTRIRASP